MRSFRRRLEQAGPSGFDPAPDIRRMETPGLWLYGALDKSIPTDRCVAILNRFRDEGKPFTVVVFPARSRGSSIALRPLHELPSRSSGGSRRPSGLSANAPDSWSGERSAPRWKNWVGAFGVSHGEPVRVLLVDDEQPFRDVARSLVEATVGFVVVVEERDSGEAALEAVAASRPDLAGAADAVHHVVRRGRRRGEAGL